MRLFFGSEELLFTQFAFQRFCVKKQIQDKQTNKLNFLFKNKKENERTRVNVFGAIVAKLQGLHKFVSFP